MNKQCSTCKRSFPLESFPTSTAHGRKVIRSYCRECLLEYYRNYERKRKELRAETVTRADQDGGLRRWG